MIDRTGSGISGKQVDPWEFFEPASNTAPLCMIPGTAYSDPPSESVVSILWGELQQ